MTDVRMSNKADDRERLAAPGDLHEASVDYDFVIIYLCVSADTRSRRGAHMVIYDGVTSCEPSARLGVDAERELWAST